MAKGCEIKYPMARLLEVRLPILRRRKCHFLCSLDLYNFKMESQPTDNKNKFVRCKRLLKKKTFMEE